MRHSVRLCKVMTSLPVADPGFSRGGAPTPKSAIIFQFFCRKLRENERIWTPGGPWRPPWIRQWQRCKFCLSVVWVSQSIVCNQWFPTFCSVLRYQNYVSLQKILLSNCVSILSKNRKWLNSQSSR